jgi:hypothetical protein
MSFGDRYPNMPQNPLDGVTRIVDEDAGTGLMQVKNTTEIAYFFAFTISP